METLAQVAPFPPRSRSSSGRAQIWIIDVGASYGLQEPWKDVEPLLRVVGFEPDAASFAALDAARPANFTYVNKALGERPGTVTLYLTRAPGGRRP